MLHLPHVNEFVALFGDRIEPVYSIRSEGNVPQLWSASVPPYEVGICTQSFDVKLTGLVLLSGHRIGGDVDMRTAKEDKSAPITRCRRPNTRELVIIIGRDLVPLALILPLRETTSPDGGWLPGSPMMKVPGSMVNTALFFTTTAPRRFR